MRVLVAGGKRTADVDVYHSLVFLEQRFKARGVIVRRNRGRCGDVAARVYMTENIVRMDIDHVPVRLAAERDIKRKKFNMMLLN